MAQTNLTKYQKEQVRLRQKYPNLHNPPVASTIRRWRRRALTGLKITTGDFEDALRSADSFRELQDQIRALEKASKRWKSGGSKWFNHDPNRPEVPESWGKSWGYYHV